MVDQVLRGTRILVVEDEYLLADDLNNALADAGAHVLGPAASVEDATALIGNEATIDAAILDVNLRGDMVFPLADALRERGIPFAFADPGGTIERLDPFDRRHDNGTTLLFAKSGGGKTMTTITLASAALPPARGSKAASASSRALCPAAPSASITGKATP